MDDAFGQRIVAGVADGSDRDFDLGLGQALGMLDPQVLRSAVRVVDQAFVILRFSLPDCRIACSGASGTNCVFMDVEVREPTIRLAKTSMTNATQTVPDQVGTWVKSLAIVLEPMAHNGSPHSLSGRPGLELAALNRRSTLSSGQGRDGEPMAPSPAHPYAKSRWPGAVRGSRAQAP